jgi:two-component system, NarL family, nitrate/nitrite response regulator NarL
VPATAIPTAPRPTSPHPHGSERHPDTGLLRIVIADDHPVYRDGIVRALMESGRYLIAGEAGDGRTALRLIVEHRPDVALLDLRMPVLDALEVLRHLERDGIHVPVVLISAFTQPQIVDQALTAGAAGYLSKDAPREEILVALDVVALGGRIVQGSAGHADGRPPLTATERSLLKLLHDGLSTDELPALTGLDADTVERHLLHSAIKLGTRNANDTLARALAHGLLE